MEKTAEQTYTDLLRQLGSPTIVEPQVLAGYLRDVERLQSMGQITEWQLQRAREAYAATIERDPRQSLSYRPESGVEAVTEPTGSRNLDPITGTPGAHPIGTGLGAAVGGIAAGAAIGTVAGPIGTAIGAVVGAVFGGLTGKGVAEMIDPTIEDTYWRGSFAARPYVGPGETYSDFGPAYAYGAKAYQANDGKAFDDVEDELAEGWDRSRDGSTLDWGRAKLATRDAWERVGRER